MDIRHDEKARQFILYGEDGSAIGELDYRNMPRNRLLALHTGVRPAHEGKGCAGMLLDAFANFARSKGATVVPRCKYVTAMFKKYPEKYGDIAAAPED